jgi:hypothetical protein
MPESAFPGIGTPKAKGVPKLCTAIGQKLDVIDIRHAAVEVNLKAEVLSLFCTRDGPRKLPTLLLYDERGLQLFEKVRLFWLLAQIAGRPRTRLSLIRSRSRTWKSTT